MAPPSSSSSPTIDTQGFDAQALTPHYDRVRNFIRRSVGSDEEAADLAQETFFRVINYGREHQIENGEHLLFRIARNLITDRFRRKKSRPEQSLESETSESECFDTVDLKPARVVEAREDIRTVEATILELPERCREVFILSRFGGHSYAEIGARLGISTSTVEKHMSRALLACRMAVSACE